MLRVDIDDILNSIHESWAEHPSNKRKHDGRRVITQLKNYVLLDTVAFTDPQTMKKDLDQLWLTKK
ncbi:MAG: hypothetical protein O2833_05800 [Proteobacteria bacterium]|nr:hypothetical protein [Pseudomonadota bacterium]